MVSSIIPSIHSQMLLDHPDRGGIINSGLTPNSLHLQQMARKTQNKSNINATQKQTVWHSRRRLYHAVPNFTTAQGGIVGFETAHINSGRYYCHEELSTRQEQIQLHRKDVRHVLCKTQQALIMQCGGCMVDVHKRYKKPTALTLPYCTQE